VTAGNPGGDRPNLKWPRVYHAVLARITDGTLRPGAAVSVRALAAEFGLGEVTVARALGRLAGDGFLERQPGFGYAVARPRAPR
jgi:DNA-binding GntR family transcriptional regulator